MSVSRGRPLSRHGTSKADAIIFMAIMGIMAAGAAWMVFGSADSSLIQKLGASAFCAGVIAVGVLLYRKFGGARFEVYPDGLMFRDGAFESFTRWEEITGYWIIKYGPKLGGVGGLGEAVVEGAIAGVQRARGKRFADSVQQMVMQTRIKDELGLSIDGKYARQVALMEAILDHVDMEIAKKAVKAVEAGQEVQFGGPGYGLPPTGVTSVKLSQAGLTVGSGTAFGFDGIQRCSALNGQLTIYTGPKGAPTALGPVPCAYAVAMAIDRLRSKRRLARPA